MNDYLAKRDSEWMGKVHRFLGLSVGLIVHDLTSDERRAAYAADITYGTNNEMGFDYLRDNMALFSSELVQRGHAFAIVDEVDSILIDEARTPLIISGIGQKSTEMYSRTEALVARFRKKVIAETDEKEEEDVNVDADYIVDEKAKTATLTARGIAKAEQYFEIENLSDPENSTIAHHINQAIKAHGTMKRDIDYVVKDGEVVIVDEFTGRLMFGRRAAEGLHQAIEAKEHVTVAREQDARDHHLQNYFPAFTSSRYDWYGADRGGGIRHHLQPRHHRDPHQPPHRAYRRSRRGGTRPGGKVPCQIIARLKECHARASVLVGTVSISERTSTCPICSPAKGIHITCSTRRTEKEARSSRAGQQARRGDGRHQHGGPRHRHHARQQRRIPRLKNDLRKAGLSDELIAEATGYAETDDQEILDARALFAEALAKHKAEIAGEADRVREAGGLFIIGTERHDSRRIDNQLRGRAGRQGDPGETRFYLSLEDDLLRLFGGERITNLMDRMNLDEDTPIENKMLSKSIENAQTSVESRNFQSRKATLEYDDVMNKQREIIYGQRKQVLDGRNLKDTIFGMIRSGISNQVTLHSGEHGKLDEDGVRDILGSLEGMYFPRGMVTETPAELAAMGEDELTELFFNAAVTTYERKEEAVTSPIMRELERVVLLRVVDEYWMDHIPTRHASCVGHPLRAYAQVNPSTPTEGIPRDVRGDDLRHSGRDCAPHFLRRIKSEAEVKRERVAEGIVTPPLRATAA